MRYLLLVFLLIGSASFAQTGNYFLSHFSPGQDRLDQVCFQIAQHENGVTYFATPTGILQFDGRSWNKINAQGAVYTLHVSDHGMIFWGGVSGVGTIEFTTQGLSHATTFPGTAKDVFQSIGHDNNVYFINDENVFVFSDEGDPIRTIRYQDSEGTLAGIYEIGGNIFLTATDGKLLRLDDAVITSTTLPYLSSGLVFSSSHKGTYLFGLSSNEIFVQRTGSRPRKLVVEDQKYLDRSVVVHGAWVSDDQIVLGTLRGGLVFINVHTGKTYEIVNSAKGLPDNEIFTLFSDRSHAVWAAHEFGFTRVVPNLPLRMFSNYGGLQGNLLCAISFEGAVYVGTSSGLFRLEKEDIYEEIHYYVNSSSGGMRKPKSAGPTAGSADATPEGDSKRRGLLGLFKKKKGSPGNDTETVKDKSSAKKNEAQSKLLKTERVLRSSHYVYKKVRGIEAKVTQLVEIDGKLIAAGLGGTFEINTLAGRQIVEEPSRYLYGSRGGLLFVSTYSDKLHILQYDRARWRIKEKVAGINDQINHIFEAENSDVWLCSPERIYHVPFAGGSLSEVRIIPVENPNYEHQVGLAFGGNLVFANSDGIFHYDQQKQEFWKIDSLSEAGLTNYFADGSSIWFRDIHGWRSLGDHRGHQNPGLLNMFRNVRFLSPDKKSGDLWVITGNNELFKFYDDRSTSYSTGFPLILKSIKNGELKQNGKRIEVLSENTTNGVSIEVVQPDYLGSMAVEYRYRLKGLDPHWSDWSQSNSVIEIPYLPSGDYILEVQSKNVFGEAKSMEEVRLNIIPPYWKRPWFYALEVMLFSSLVLLSFRLSVRYRIISRLLMLLTIIILIQLVETLVGDTLETNESPVVDFVVQVVIAMLILPVEGFLRERMFRSLEIPDRFSRFILPKAPRELDENVVDN